MQAPYMYTITDGVLLSPLCLDDSDALADYFESLSAQTRARFQPHPLTRDSARAICNALENPPARFCLRQRDSMIGYFIVTPRMPVHEIERFARVGIGLEAGRDFAFAPSVADAHQGRGLASLAMPHLMAIARKQGARSLVLLGGTQETNAQGIRFYERFGFQRCGGYYTDVFNHDMQLVLSI